MLSNVHWLDVPESKSELGLVFGLALGHPKSHIVPISRWCWSWLDWAPGFQLLSDPSLSVVGICRVDQLTGESSLSLCLSSEKKKKNWAKFREKLPVPWYVCITASRKSSWRDAEHTAWCVVQSTSSVSSLKLSRAAYRRTWKVTCIILPNFFRIEKIRAKCSVLHGPDNKLSAFLWTLSLKTLICWRLLPRWACITPAPWGLILAGTLCSNSV